MIHVELAVPPVWGRVRDVHEALLHTARAVGLTENCAEALGVAASELLENAIKYGIYASSEQTIALVVHMASEAARVVVTNPIDPSSEHVQRLRSAVARLSESNSPLDAYLGRMKEILEEEPAASQVVPRAPSLSHRSGLGIFRVAHEGESVVSVRFLSERAVEVTASMNWCTGGRRGLVA